MPSTRSNVSGRIREVEEDPIVKRRRLELTAAEERVRIQLEALEEKTRLEIELVDRRLALEIAQTQSEKSDDTMCNGDQSSYSHVNEWLSRNNQVSQKSCEGDGEGDCRLQASDVNQESTLGEPNRPVSLKHVVQALDRTVDTLRRQVGTSGSGNYLVRRLTSTRQLPKFSGCSLEWLQFKRAFELTSELGNYSEEENVSRLFNCLEGEARKAVEALMISSSNAKQVMDTLELRFGNPDVITQKIVRDLRHLPSLSSGKTDLATLATTVQNGVVAMTAISRTGYLHDPELVAAIIRKLPSAMIYSYNRYLHDNPVREPRLKVLADFLYQEAEMACIAGTDTLFKVQRLPELKNKRDKVTERRKGRPYSTTTCATLRATQEEPQAKRLKGEDQLLRIECGYCRKENHKIIECRHFKNLTVNDRWKWAAENRKCYRCLIGRHRYNQCKATGCKKEPKCRERHNELLHNDIGQTKIQERRIENSLSNTDPSASGQVNK